MNILQFAMHTHPECMRPMIDRFLSLDDILRITADIVEANSKEGLFDRVKKQIFRSYYRKRLTPEQIDSSKTIISLVPHILLRNFSGDMKLDLDWSYYGNVLDGRVVNNNMNIVRKIAKILEKKFSGETDVLLKQLKDNNLVELWLKYGLHFSQDPIRWIYPCSVSENILYREASIWISHEITGGDNKTPYELANPNRWIPELRFIFEAVYHSVLDNTRQEEQYRGKTVDLERQVERLQKAATFSTVEVSSLQRTVEELKTELQKSKQIKPQNNGAPYDVERLKRERDDALAKEREAIELSSQVSRELELERINVLRLETKLSEAQNYAQYQALYKAVERTGINPSILEAILIGGLKRGSVRNEAYIPVPYLRSNVFMYFSRDEKMMRDYESTVKTLLAMGLLELRKHDTCITLTGQIGNVPNQAVRELVGFLLP